MTIRHLAIALIGTGTVTLTVSVAFPAQAALLSRTFGGILTEVRDPSNLFGGATTFTGSYIYDTNTPDENGGADGDMLASYVVSPVPPGQGLSLAIGNVNFSFESRFSRRFGNSPGFKFYIIDAGRADQPLPYAQLFLGDPDGTALSSASPTSEPTSLAGWDDRAFTFYINSLQGSYASGTLTYLNPTSVPEPSFMLGTLAAGSLLGIRKYRKGCVAKTKGERKL